MRPSHRKLPPYPTCRENPSRLAATRLWPLALPEELRYTVTAVFWGDLPVKEIARQEGITPVGIRKRLKKAFRLLALALEEDAR